MVDLNKEHPLYPGFTLDVINQCVQCRECHAPILLVFDPAVRDKHDECGGKPNGEFSKELVRKYYNDKRSNK